MAYFLDLFSPQTYEAFSKSDQSISGFRLRQDGVARRVSPGDKLVCYMTKLSRWIGVLEVVDGPFRDDAPIFVETDDPFVVRFHVRPISWLPVERSIPIHDDTIWNTLTITHGQNKATSTWTGKFRSSLAQLETVDGVFLEEALARQSSADASDYPFDLGEYKKMLGHQVRRIDKAISVTIPEDEEAGTLPAPPDDIRESIRIQALLSDIGSKMGMQLWIPRSDRSLVLREWSGRPSSADRETPAEL